MNTDSKFYSTLFSKKYLFYLILPIFILLISGCGEQKNTNTPPGMAAAGPAISPILVGNNVWMYPNDQVWEISGQAVLKVIRIGGIAFDEHLPSNKQLTAWIDQIKAMGAEPMLQVSQYDDPQAAADLVRYFNMESDNPIRYWNIGNEPNCGDEMNTLAGAAQIAAFIKEIAPAMKAVDPTIKIFAPDECDFVDIAYGALFKGDNSATDISGKVPDQDYYYIDGISWHRYIGFPPARTDIDGLTTAGANDFLVRIQETQELIDQANAAQGRTGEAALQWGIGEFNSSDGARVCSYENGQMFAQIYGYIMKYGGAYGATWSMYENGGRCTGTDFSFINKDMTPRASFYHMQMISENFSGFYLDATTNLDSIQAFGAIDPDQDKIVVMVLNIDTVDDHTCTIRLDSDPVDTNDCHISLPASVPVEHLQPIGAQTSMVLIFDLQGQLVKTITYSLGEQWRNGQAPIVTISANP